MNNNLNNKEIHDNTPKRNSSSDEFQKKEAHAAKEDAKLRDIEVKPSREGAKDITPLKGSRSKYVSVHCSPEDKERLKEMAIMNETTMVHLMEIGVQHMATKENFDLQEKVSNLQYSPTIRINPDDKKTLKKLAFKYRTTNLNMIANIVGYLENRYK
ncbi:hypothetical protein [Marinococcus halotolerans]|uniref:hypothetical protein n=1 Tax=Marinococcus halotolerans TaxID=301092 RepID=UPI0003B44243|nr:hypothetical protein [Marinococcus halotolerans]